MLKQPGYLVLIAAISMMAGLLAVDVSQLPTFADASLSALTAASVAVLEVLIASVSVAKPALKSAVA